MNKHIKDLKEIIDDELLTPSERYNKLIRYVNNIYKFMVEEDNKKEETDEISI